MLVREGIVLQMLNLAARGVREEGANNRGRIVDMIEDADSLGGHGYPWCAATVQYAARMATGARITAGKVVGGYWIAGGTAAVGLIHNAAKAAGILVTRPRRGDLALFDFGSGWPTDHIGAVERVLGLGPVLFLQTVEGNTGPTGAVSDPGTGGDGVYRKRRIVRASKVAFVRVAGTIGLPSTFSSILTPAPGA